MRPPTRPRAASTVTDSPFAFAVRAGVVFMLVLLQDAVMGEVTVAELHEAAAGRAPVLGRLEDGHPHP